MGVHVTIIRVWKGGFGQIELPTNQGTWTGNWPVLAGHTLVRTLLTVHLMEFFNTPSFPPLPAVAVRVAYYQAVNTTSPIGLPDALNGDADFVASGSPQWFADFGVTSAVQSDLNFHATADFDVKSERKALVANPAWTVSFSNLGAPPGGNMRVRLCTMSFSIRTLWQHQI
jgi:hypothetical protein